MLRSYVIIRRPSARGLLSRSPSWATRYVYDYLKSNPRIDITQVRALKYQRMKLRYQLFTLEPKLKKKRPDLAADESDMDEDFMERHEEDLLEKAQEAARKKWEKDNVKLKEDKEDKKPKAILDERLKEIKAEFKELAKERKTKKVEPRKNSEQFVCKDEWSLMRKVTEERFLDSIGKMDDRISTAIVQMGDRDKTKDVALGTSK